MKRLKIFRCGGVLIEFRDTRFLIDPWGVCEKKVDFVFISHAHLDHVSGLKNFGSYCPKFFMSRQTFKILREFNLLPQGCLNISFVDAGDSIDLGGVEVSFYNSGHVVGGLMMYFDFKGLTLGYTGDFNFEGSAVLEPAEVLNVDILILDTTYGHPQYSFPPRSLLYKKTREVLNEVRDEGKTPVLHGFSLGKGQELTKLATMFLGEPIGVDRRVGYFNKIYESSLKRGLGKYIIGGGGEAIVRGMRRRRRQDSNFVHIIFTGWAMSNSFDAALGIPLSSHTGFVKLLEYVIESEPSKIFTLFGFENFFAKFIKKDLKIEAMPLPSMPQEISFFKTSNLAGKRYFSLENYL